MKLKSVQVKSEGRCLASPRLASPRLVLVLLIVFY